jgi:hypothetical protein
MSDVPKLQYERATLPAQSIEKHGGIPASIPKAPRSSKPAATSAPPPPAALQRPEK